MTKTKTKKTQVPDHATPEQWKRAAQRELHPELAALHTEHETAVAYYETLRAPAEPTRDEIAEIGAKLRTAWRESDRGDDVIATWNHDYFDGLDRRRFAAAAARNAVRAIEYEINLAQEPTDDTIAWLDGHARRIIDEARADTNDLNLLRDKRIAFTALIGAYAGIALKLGLNRDDIDSGFAWLANIDEVSARHRAHLAGLTDWRNRAEPWGGRRDNWFDYLIRTPEAQVKLRTPAETRAVRAEMDAAARKATAPPTSRHRPIDRSRGDTDAKYPPVPRSGRW